MQLLQPVRWEAPCLVSLLELGRTYVYILLSETPFCQRVKASKLSLEGVKVSKLSLEGVKVSKLFLEKVKVLELLVSEVGHI